MAIMRGHTRAAGINWSYADLAVATGKLIQRLSVVGATTVMRGIGILS
jgi:hypothetical protein